MNKNSGKLLVAVLAMFMIVAGIAVVFSDSEVNASANPGIEEELTESQTITLTGETSGDLMVGLEDETYSFTATGCGPSSRIAWFPATTRDTRHIAANCCYFIYIDNIRISIASN